MFGPKNRVGRGATIQLTQGRQSEIFEKDKNYVQIDGLQLAGFV